MNSKHSHNFDHSHSHNIDMTESKSILVAFFLNITFVVIEFFGGFYSNSFSIISDAIHDLGDSITLLFTFFLSIYANKGRDNNYTYGYKRILIVGALLNSIILISGSVYIYFESVDRILHPEVINAKIMFLISIIGILVNGFSFYKMSKTNSLMGKSVMLHLLEDLLGWISVFISSIVIMALGLYRIDAILSFAIATVILLNALKTLKKAFEILLQKVPRNIDIDEIEKQIMSCEYIKEVHDIHVWTLDGYDVIFTAHIVVDDINFTPEEIDKLKSKVKIGLESIGINHATLEFETEEQAIEHGPIEL